MQEIELRLSFFQSLAQRNALVEKTTRQILVVQLNYDVCNLKGVAEMTKKEVLVVLLIGLVVNVGGYICIQKWLRHDAKIETATSVRP